MFKRKPKFAKQNAHRKKRASRGGWRVPRGYDSKQRRNKMAQPKRPNIGYGTGHKNTDVIVHNVDQLSKLKEGTNAKISRTVGNKKKIEILKAAKERKIRILNE